MSETKPTDNNPSDISPANHPTNVAQHESQPETVERQAAKRPFQAIETTTTSLLDLPDCLLRQILGMVSYGQIAKMREVCARFNDVCAALLNSGFSRMIRLQQAESRRVKAQLPRRESERRNHQLSRHADVMTSLDTRISMLTMTYAKYIDMGLCCFIPGAIIDEVLRILRLLAVRPLIIQLRVQELLLELRDLSSMAIDHFDEQVKRPIQAQFREAGPSSSATSTLSAWSADAYWSGRAQPNPEVTSLQADVDHLRRTIESVRTVYWYQRKKLHHQSLQIAELQRIVQLHLGGQMQYNGAQPQYDDQRHLGGLPLLGGQVQLGGPVAAAPVRQPAAEDPAGAKRARLEANDK